MALWPVLYEQQAVDGFYIVEALIKRKKKNIPQRLYVTSTPKIFTLWPDRKGKGLLTSV